MGALYSHLSTIERARIEALTLEGASIREIGRRLNRSPNTVSWEKHKCLDETYDTASAQEYTEYLRIRAGVARRILGRSHYDFLNQYLTPTVTVQGILGRLSREKKGYLLPASSATCYRFIRRSPTLRLLLPHRVRRSWGTAKTDARTRAFQEARPISERPLEAQNRTQLGHRETDLVCGPRVGSGTDVLVSSDRKSRHYVAAKLPHGKDADELEAVIVPLHAGVTVLSLTADRGKEFARWKGFSKSLEAEFYVTNPHAPWEKPTVEWENGLLRRFLPKGTDFGMVKPYRLKRAVRAINHTPRKCLEWKTPHEEQYGVEVSYFK